MSALLDALGLLAASKRTFIQFSTEHHCQSTRLTNVMTHWTKYWVSFKRFSRIVVKVVVFALKDTQKDGKLQLCKVWIKDTQNLQQHYGLKINRSPKSCNLPRVYWCFFRSFRIFIITHKNSPIRLILNSSILRFLIFFSFLLQDFKDWQCYDMPMLFCRFCITVHMCGPHLSSFKCK